MTCTLRLIGLVILLLSSSCVFSQDDVGNVTAAVRSGVLVFRSSSYDFGELAYGSQAVGRFMFKNKSRASHSIREVRSSCGCASVDWPRGQIKPKMRGCITVSYDTELVGRFNKRLYVYLDDDTLPMQLGIHGKVLPPKMPATSQ